MVHFQALHSSDFTNRVVPGNPMTPAQTQRGIRQKPFLKKDSLWQKVAKAAMVEHTYQPAARKVCVVKPAFAVAGLAARRHETAGLIQLLYDSSSQPAPAGIRSAAMPIRQMLYRADPYQVDLQIELLTEQNRFVVTGQLVDLSHPELVGRDVQVMLSDGRQYMVNTVTNQFGEFRGEVKNSGDLEITFLGRSGKPIVILLRGALEPLSEARGTTS